MPRPNLPPRLDIPDLHPGQPLPALRSHLRQDPLRPAGRVDIGPDWIRREQGPADESVRLLRGVKVLDLDLDLVAVRVAVVHAAGHAVVDGPVGLDAEGRPEVLIHARHLREGREGEGEVFEAGDVLAGLGPRVGRHEDADAVVLVVVAEEGERRLLQDDLRVEQLQVEPDHRLVVRGRAAEDDVCQRDRTRAWDHLVVAFRCRRAIRSVCCGHW